jgi:hypothetical protein
MAETSGLCDTVRHASCRDLNALLWRIVASPYCGSSSFLCANLAIGSTDHPTRSFPMAAAKKSSSRSGGRKRSRSGSSGRKSGRRKVAGRKRPSRSRSGNARKSSGARKKSSRRKGGRKSSSSRKSGGRKSSSRKKSTRPRRRSQSPVARVKRVATGVVHQAAGLGERAVDTVTEFVQDRF